MLVRNKLIQEATAISDENRQGLEIHDQIPNGWVVISGMYGMVYAILSPEEFANQYEAIPD